jgi:hypothetical protein
MAIGERDRTGPECWSPGRLGALGNERAGRDSGSIARWRVESEELFAGGLEIRFQTEGGFEFGSRFRRFGVGGQGKAEPDFLATRA